jgi:uncharacterized SAM-binding protein YcdF (DUF218 family)
MRGGRPAVGKITDWMNLSALPARRFCGFFVRRECWCISRRGWLAGLATAALLLYALARGVYPFLSITDRLKTDTLVIEGWIDDYALRAGVQEFKTGSYQRVFTTGGPESGNGGYTSDENTSAGLGARMLKRLGVPPESVFMAPSREMGWDRTYNSAIALRNWFRDHQVPVAQFNIVSESVHARRTRLLFQKAFGDAVKIGIISVPNPDYDATRWWRYSQGVKDVISEGTAYLYARFLFYPNDL